VENPLGSERGDPAFLILLDFPRAPRVPPGWFGPASCRLQPRPTTFCCDTAMFHVEHRRRWAPTADSAARASGALTRPLGVSLSKPGPRTGAPRPTWRGYMP